MNEARLEEFYGRLLLALASCRFTYGNEIQLQDQLEGLWKTMGVAYEREKRLVSGDRPDFLIKPWEGLPWCIAVEVKIKGEPSSHLRQISKYLGDDTIHGLFLMSTRGGPIPTVIRGKPCRSISLWRNLTF